MERQEVPIRFTDLRQLASAVPAYLTEHTCETTVPPLTARIEDDLGCTGDDMVELLETFIDTYHVDVANFDFTGLISPEGLDSRGCLLAVPLAMYWLMAWLLKAAATLLCWPFTSSLAHSIWRWQPFPAFGISDRPPALTIGDFVASAAVGRFVRREQVYFRLVR